MEHTSGVYTKLKVDSSMFKWSWHHVAACRIVVRQQTLVYKWSRSWQVSFSVMLILVLLLHRRWIDSDD